VLPSLPSATVFVSEELLGGRAASAPLSSEPEADGLLNTTKMNEINNIVFYTFKPYQW